MGQKKCGKCGEEKSFDRFHKNKNKEDGLQGQCIDCRSIKKKHLIGLHYSVDGVAYVPLSNKKNNGIPKAWTKIDVDDVDKVFETVDHWCLGKNGYSVGKCKKRNKVVLMHRLIMDVVDAPNPKQVPVDHKNIDNPTNTLDNRKSNLRIVSESNNRHNSSKPKTNTSGFKGVTWHHLNKKWIAQIGINNRHLYLGSFDTPEEAHAAYCEAGKQLHKEFFHE